MHKLRPFHEDSRTQEFQIKAAILHFSKNHYRVQFSVTGPLQNIRWPSPDYKTHRQDELWQHTCLEAFLSDSLEDDSPYVEINASPAGNWNLYNFSGYRQGRTDFPGEISVKRRNSANCAQFQLEIKTADAAAFPLQFCGLSVILQFADGEKSYWALDHQSAQADFHNKKSWKTLTTR